MCIDRPILASAQELGLTSENLWRVRDSNPRRLSRLIYSQIPLAAWVTRHALPTGVFTNRVRENQDIGIWSNQKPCNRDQKRHSGYHGEMADSSFDIVSKVDPMELENAVNQAHKELSQRYDFKGVDANIEKSGDGIALQANSEERVKAVLDVLQSKLIKRGISLKSLETSEPALSGKVYKINAAITDGISSENAKKITALIRAEGPKTVKTQIQGEEVRVSSKSRDDLQAVIALVKGAALDFDAQFVNYR